MIIGIKSGHIPVAPQMPIIAAFPPYMKNMDKKFPTTPGSLHQRKKNAMFCTIHRQMITVVHVEFIGAYRIPAIDAMSSPIAIVVIGGIKINSF